jgi:hypothetical protein
VDRGRGEVPGHEAAAVAHGRAQETPCNSTTSASSRCRSSREQWAPRRAGGRRAWGRLHAAVVPRTPGVTAASKREWVPRNIRNIRVTEVSHPSAPRRADAPRAPE